MNCQDITRIADTGSFARLSAMERREADGMALNLGSGDPITIGDVARQLWTFTANELQRVQQHMLLLIKSAQERVACFLLEMAERRSSGNAVELPMSRQDIADYLGLTIETVSRTLTSLENANAIEVPTSRRIVLRNRVALSRLNG